MWRFSTEVSGWRGAGTCYVFFLFKSQTISCLRHIASHKEEILRPWATC